MQVLSFNWEMTGKTYWNDWAQAEYAICEMFWPKKHGETVF